MKNDTIIYVHIYILIIHYSLTEINRGPIDRSITSFCFINLDNKDLRYSKLQ